MIIKHRLPIQLLLRHYSFRLLHFDRCENLSLQTHANAVFPDLAASTRFERYPCEP